MTAEWLPFDGKGPRPIARNADPWTSHAAAEDAVLSADNNRALAYRTIKASGSAGLTDYELEKATGVQQNSIGKRRGDLCKMGLVADSGRTRLRPQPTRSQSECIVWVAVEFVDQVAAK